MATLFLYFELLTNKRILIGVKLNYLLLCKFVLYRVVSKLEIKILLYIEERKVYSPDSR